MNIIIYKSAVCPQCKVIKAKLEKKGFTFTEELDVNVIAANGVNHIPTLSVDGELITDLRTINKWINEHEVEANG